MRQHRFPVRSGLGSLIGPSGISGLAALLAAGWLMYGNGGEILAAIVLSATLSASIAFLFQGSKIALREREIVALRQALESLHDREWELRESEERYRTMAEAFGDLAMLRDSAGRILFVNEPFARILGGSPQAIIGTKPEPKIIRSAIQTGAVANSPAASEVELETPTGPRWFHWIDMPVRDERTNRAVLRTLAREITSHKLAERALESARKKAESANRAKSRFLGMVSHEMRTPLNGIIGMAHLIRGTRLSLEQRAYADAIRSSGDALLRLIEDLLDLTLIEAGRFELKPSEIDPRQLVEEVCELLYARTRNKGIELATVLSPDIPRKVSVDAGRLRQVLVNLIGNAVKFTDKGGVVVSIDTTRNRNGLSFSIRDTGPGMSSEDATRIFQEFEQADSAITRRHGGAGLGLSISQRIIRRLGGEIIVETSPGHGANFKFTVTTETRQPPPASAKSALRGQAVLIISPGKLESAAIAETIRAAGGRVTIVHTLGAARQVLARKRGRSRKFNSLILDPSISRDPVTSLRRLLGRKGAAPYSIILVQPGMRDLRDSCLAGGFDGFLVRPVRQASLLRILDERRDVAAEYRRSADACTPPIAVDTNMPAHDILLAEDNEINALLVRSVLEKAGQRVIHVDDGQKAVAACRAKLAAGAHFGLVLMDLHMPRMDGAAAIREIRRLERRKGVAPSRIVTLTADEQAAARSRSADAGSDGFVTKPIDPAALVRELHALER